MKYFRSNHVGCVVAFAMDGVIHLGRVITVDRHAANVVILPSATIVRGYSAGQVIITPDRVLALSLV